MTLLRHFIRFAVTAIVLLLVGWIVPGFQVVGFWTAFLAAIIIAAIGWGIEAFMGPRLSPYSRGFIGFIVSAVVIYFTQFFLAGLRVTLIGAILAAIVIGIADLFVPAKPRFAGGELGDR
ncbi:phage holin family protein [Ammoniphilus sp. CFH 90114]|uniref:phage holin family protein n=1 Tax=Ammoniphilus sp. CFH 90114 TaxID=2493665 RepID=UPI00100E435B|nr:phage holin family protein [Ammoniphilus sp. CFH 90114]RXT06525.1 phage holin family protein [Ammoniphilus sp. CFH 90114]